MLKTTALLSNMTFSHFNIFLTRSEQKMNSELNLHTRLNFQNNKKCLAAAKRRGICVLKDCFRSDVADQS